LIGIHGGWAEKSASEKLDWQIIGSYFIMLFFAAQFVGLYFIKGMGDWTLYAGLATSWFATSTVGFKVKKMRKEREYHFRKD